jgi:hypothetical protein
MLVSGLLRLYKLASFFIAVIAFSAVSTSLFTTPMYIGQYFVIVADAVTVFV